MSWRRRALMRWYPMQFERLGRALGRAAHARRRRGAFQRPFAGKSSRRLLLLSVDHRIPQSQIFPFHYYAPAFLTQHQTEIREVTTDQYGSRDSHPKGATTVCFQTNFDISDADLDALLGRIHARNPGARLVYLDWFAPTDLRLAARIGPRVDAYLSKHILRDRAAYLHPTFGDTTLMDHYGRRFGLPHTTQHHSIPDGFMDKLHLGPSFATADFMLPVFHKGALPPSAPRPVDLHARLAVAGTPWYQAMRGECAAAVAALDGVRTITGTGIRHDLFLREMRASKLCFSPFGYGEACWRDYEAVMTGAVLIKQDMGHVQTDPDIFRPFESYVPVKWDLSDLDEKIRWLLADEAARARIAGAAFALLQDYARSGRFVTDMAGVIA